MRERLVISDRAIAGCYLFAGADIYLRALESLRASNPYPELFVSGMYNVLAHEGRRIVALPLADHMAFGTPSELGRITPERLARYADWS